MVAVPLPLRLIIHCLPSEEIFHNVQISQGATCSCCLLVYHLLLQRKVWLYRYLSD